jgi:hypothetical protein
LVFLCRPLTDKENDNLSLRPLRLVYLSQELFLMISREAGKIIFKMALVTENVTLTILVFESLI